MSFETALGELADPAKRLTSEQLTSFSQLTPEESAQLAEVWPDLPVESRLGLLLALTDLAQDNVELNFDAVYRHALQDEEPSVRAAAIRGLHEYERSDVIPIYIGFLRQDADAEVRREAAIALGRYALAAELGQIDESEGARIKEALFESAEDEMEDERVRARAIEAAGAFSGEDTENLIESIYREESLWLKVGAVDAMGRSCDAVWLSSIFEEMHHRAPEMRHAAVFAAGEIGAEEAIEPLKEAALRDPDREVQLAAIHALGEIGGRQARVALKAILIEGEDELREAVEEAISEAEFNENPLGPTL